MPELPDVTAYIAALEARVLGRRLEKVRLGNPFVLRTVAPPLRAAEGREVVALRRLAKRIAIGLDGGLWLLIHLMIAGRLHWRKPGAGLPGRRGLAAFDFADGTLTLTESSSKKRASLHLLEGEAALEAHRPPGLEPLEIDLAAFRSAITAENRTLKRALTDQRILAGIGNAYSDEILHAAGLSPVTLTRRLDEVETARLYHAMRDTLTLWTGRFVAEAAAAFPEKVTAFRPEMAVHGKYGQPCPACGTRVQRIVHADNETNYCPRCQTAGRLLADRALSTVLKADWPKTIEELEGRG
jgi:formamidopyrimidine-DNA glycosylase